LVRKATARNGLGRTAEDDGRREDGAEYKQAHGEISNGIYANDFIACRGERHPGSLFAPRADIPLPANIAKIPAFARA
jgi:hypothetical protein